MKNLILEGKTYLVDADGFLLDHDRWDEAFAEGTAPTIGIPQGLSKRHWDIIHFIRKTFVRNRKCPLLYETCKANKLRLKDLQKLFPTGYLRGACKLAGITYKEGFHGAVALPTAAAAYATEKPRVMAPGGVARPPEKTYMVDVRGFLVNPDDWDEEYAVFKAYEMGMSVSLTERHWQIIRYLRDGFAKNRVIPTVYETCEANNVEIEELEKLFPTGYHRGAVKIAGLRAR